MKRQVRLEEISDGRLYSANDMVKADCKDCQGCSACCHGMGDSIQLDPYDIWRLTTGLGKSFEQLLQEQAITLSVSDGTILPHLNLSGSEDACHFLNEQGRCSIHPYRPGICRMFPLGRYYTEDGFAYILQTHECKQEHRAKIKVRKWLDIPQLPQYEQYILEWHQMLVGIQSRIQAEGCDSAYAKTVNMQLLQQFYLTPYGTEDFYSAFWERMAQVSF